MSSRSVCDHRYCSTCALFVSKSSLRSLSAPLSASIRLFAALADAVPGGTGRGTGRDTGTRGRARARARARGRAGSGAGVRAKANLSPRSEPSPTPNLGGEGEEAASEHGKAGQRRRQGGEGGGVARGSARVTPQHAAHLVTARGRVRARVGARLRLRGWA